VVPAEEDIPNPGMSRFDASYYSDVAANMKGIRLVGRSFRSRRRRPRALQIAALAAIGPACPWVSSSNSEGQMREKPRKSLSQRTDEAAQVKSADPWTLSAVWV
jgi:hypothetical protein